MGILYLPASGLKFLIPLWGSPDEKLLWLSDYFGRLKFANSVFYLVLKYRQRRKEVVNETWVLLLVKHNFIKGGKINYCKNLIFCSYDKRGNNG
jgi:hypothetical protein